MSKKAQELLEQIEEFVSNESTDMISRENLFDIENWEDIPEDQLEEVIRELIDEGNLVKKDDYYQVIGSNGKKLQDFEDMTSGGWED